MINGALYFKRNKLVEKGDTILNILPAVTEFMKVGLRVHWAEGCSCLGGG